MIPFPAIKFKFLLQYFLIQQVGIPLKQEFLSRQAVRKISNEQESKWLGLE